MVQVARGLGGRANPARYLICGHAILNEQIFAVGDASRDERFSDNPLVTGDLHLRFYMGVPLTSVTGHRLGTLCAIDRRPRLIHPEQVRLLQDLGRTVEAIIQARELALDSTRILEAARQSEGRLQKEVFSHAHRLQEVNLALTAQLLRAGELDMKRRLGEERLRLLVDNLPACVAYFDNRRAGVIANHMYTRTYGPPELAGMLHEVSKSHPTCVDAAYAGERQSFMHRRRDESGHEHIGQVYLAPGGEGEARGLLALEVDVTAMVQARRALEAEKQVSEQALALAQRANEHERTFVANVSHELRTPLNGVIGMTDLLLDTGLSAEQRRYIEVTRSCSKHLLSLIEDILHLSRANAAKIELAPEPVVVRDFLAAKVAILSEKAQRRGLSIHVEVAPDVPEAVIGDAARLSQVILNFLANAVKFTDAGRIDVRVKVLAAVDNKFTLRWEVADQGIGIAPEHADRLFKPFSQIDPSITRRFGGTGLGLAISESLAKLMGGRVVHEPVQPHGSIFALELHMARASAPTTTLKPTQAQQHCAPPSHILVAEDNELNQFLIISLLKKLGHRVTVVNHGQAVLDAMAKEHFDLVFMDCQMPGMDGYTATRKIRDIEAWADIPVVALTANVMPDDRRRCLAAGMNGYISKPIEREMLIATLNLHLARR